MPFGLGLRLRQGTSNLDRPESPLVLHHNTTTKLGEGRNWPICDEKDSQQHFPCVNIEYDGEQPMNFAKYPWLKELSSEVAQLELLHYRNIYETTGAVTLPDFITKKALQLCLNQVTSREENAYTTDDLHTAYLVNPDLGKFPYNSVYNHKMRTRVASLAYDELGRHSVLRFLYQDPILLQLVSFIVQKELYLSVDPLGCCSINVFRPGYYHAFHFDESPFSTTLMIQEADDLNSGLFQYTDLLRDLRYCSKKENLALSNVASAINTYEDDSTIFQTKFHELQGQSNVKPPPLHTLDFHPGTLSIFAGSQSLHRVTTIKGTKSRLVAIFTFSTISNFRNSAAVQKLFWGRSSEDINTTNLEIR
jgi:hypothetical protein